jgi:hypothetical protein
LASRGESYGDGKKGDEEEDLKECVDSKDEGRKACEERHALYQITKETKFEFECSLQRPESPACSLLEMSRESIWNGTILKSFVAKSCLPSGTK